MKRTVRRAAKRRAKANPPLAIFANPRGAPLLSKQVIAIAYRHAEDGKQYKHEFAPGVEMRCLPDGSIHIRSPRGVRLWGDYTT